MLRRWSWWLIAAALFVGGCGGGGGGGSEISQTLDQRVVALCVQNNLRGSPHIEEAALTPAQLAIRDKRRDLGRSLFFDHALSGVEQTSCATCHHAAFQFSDARNIARGVFCDLVPEVSITCHEAPPPGEDGNVLGPDRRSPLNSRNTPSLIDNVLYPRLMWNGRFRFNDTRSSDVNELDSSLGFRFPAPENDLFTRSLLAGQAEIPVTELVEMTGDFPHGDGKIEEDLEEAHEEVRNGIAARIDFIPAYRALFEEAYPADRPDLVLSPQDPVVGHDDDLTYAAVGDAIGHFMESLVMTDAPFDHYLQGDLTAISDAAKRGAEVFMEDGRCSSCHAGDLFSDFENYNIGVPQVGPGTGFGSPHDPDYVGKTNWDFGLEEITTNREDRFKFRTPPLRGVALTSPYMHNGAYARLEDAIRHHTDPAAAYAAYDISQIEPDMQAYGLNPPPAVFNPINPVVLGLEAGQTRIDLTDEQIADLIEFLKSLTDPRMLDTDSLTPTSVPSGLPLDVPGPRRFPLYQ